MRYLQTIPLLLSILAGAAHASCEFDIEVGDSLTFSETELNVDSNCESITINLAHTGQMPAVAMGHNWVLTTTPEVSDVANDGLAAGLANNWVKTDDERVIANTKLIGGGESDSITFPVDALEIGGDYTYVCTAPGHWQAMQGKLIFR